MVPENFRWEYGRISETQLHELTVETGYPENFARLLAARGIVTKADADKFLNPSADQMYDPFLMKGMAEAAKRIMEAIDNHEKITIYGDYDVDGITATSILYLYFTDLGADVAYYLPDRMTEGYGLNVEAIAQIAADGTKLMITVDTGITAIKECAYAKTCGMDVIVTDHHECLEDLPDAVAVVDTKQPGETYPFRYLAGCGVAYKVVQAVAAFRKDAQNIRRFLELAAVGTVADIVQLYDENRMIVSEGFRRMKQPEIMGLYKLLESAGYDFKRRIKTGFIGFGVAPRLNAGGRMGDAKRGVRLFTTTDEAEAVAIADELNVENTHRKETEQLILSEVLEKIDASPLIRNSRVIIVSGESWHHGVIGIVSSRIKDAYYRPNIIFAVENGIATGSARSIEGFNLFEALCTCSDLMIKFGGHAAAAGMSLKVENIPELNRRLNEYAAAHMDSRMLTPVLHPEISISPSELTIPFIRLIERLEPFGPEMPEPVIEVTGRIDEIKAIGGDGQTLRVRLSDGRQSFSAIGFRKAILKSYYTNGRQVSIAGNADINEYMGRQYPQIMIKDIHMEQEWRFERIARAFALRHVTQDFVDFCRMQPKMAEGTCQASYQFLSTYARKNGLADEGFIMLQDLPEERLVPLLLSLCVFEELSLMSVESNGCYLHYQFLRDKKAKLVDSRWYCDFF